MQMLEEFRRQFHVFFKTNLSEYMHPVFGFDIIKFDDFLKTPNGESTKNFIGEKYGSEAIVLIEKLLRIR